MFRIEYVLFLFMIKSIYSQSSSPTVGKNDLNTVSSPNENFLDLIRQRFENPVNIQQCPCVIPPGSDRCIAYDPRYLAASVEEAIIAFVDLTVDEFNGEPLNRNDYNCSTDECIQCAALIFYRLKEIGFIDQSYRSRFNFPLPLLQDMHPRRCRRFWITRRRTLRGPPTIVPPYVQQMINAGQQHIDSYARFQPTQYSQKVIQTLSHSQGSQYQTVYDSTLPQNQVFTQVRYETIGEIPPPPLPTPPPQQPPIQLPQVPYIPPYYPPQVPTPPPTSLDPLSALIQAKIRFIQHILLGLRRKKRNTPNVSDSKNIIGERFVISCVEKGDSESDETDFMNLCTACWTWRRLPDNYFPPILNELVCQENDFCLSGWGTCTQRYRQVDVLRKVNGKWNPTTIVSGACCDCKVRAGTEIHQLVIGNTRRPERIDEGIIPLALRETKDQPIIMTRDIPIDELNINNNEGTVPSS